MMQRSSLIAVRWVAVLLPGALVILFHALWTWLVGPYACMPWAVPAEVAALLAGGAAVSFWLFRLIGKARARHEEADHAHKRLERLVHVCQDAIVLLDATGQTLLWNSGAERLYGLTAAEATGRPVPFLPPDQEEAFRQHLDRIVSGGAGLDPEEGLHRHKESGLVPVLVSLSPVRAGPDEPVMALMVARNLTAQKRLEAQRRRLALLEARERIGMDLHDGAVQELYAVGLGLEAIRRALPAGQEQVREDLAVATAELNRVIHDLRAYILDQQPRAWSGRGLLAELTELADRLRDEGGLRIRLEPAIYEEPPPEVTGQLLHIAAEALSNVLRHSGSREARVILHVDAALARLEVVDGGCGFDTAAGAAGHLGLRNMRARAESLGGACTVTSAPGQGTAVRVSVPLEGDDAV